MQDLQHLSIDGRRFYLIADVDRMRPFFMSMVSASNHWLFIASNGGLTAGRKNSEYALFPYYTDDKITESVEHTGSKTILRIEREEAHVLWEPFSLRSYGKYQLTRNLYKSEYGDQIIFEEVNHDLQLIFRYRWSSSQAFGFVRRASLENTGQNTCRVSLLDGLQNILPYGVESNLQKQSSNLVDAYKRSELHAESGLGIYALSAIIVDKAEPSEALKANAVWSYGLDNPKYLLSSLQLDAFRRGETIIEERDIKGERGAYFVQQKLALAPGETEDWSIVANVNQNQADLARLIQAKQDEETLIASLEEDVMAGTERLINLVAAADGLQETADSQRDSRHFANVMFNIMRGGIFDHNYQIERNDFSAYLARANRSMYDRMLTALTGLPEVFSLEELNAFVAENEDTDLRRLATEYLPLKFSRRHGDPSRPWNKFSINTQNELDGSKVLDYEGNWRDIFQNWEALAHAYPNFVEGMIFRFLNASTFDGYNPYRVTKDGFDWEIIEPDDPWSYIGYWGDHQLIYLLKLLEFSEKHQPGRLTELFEQEIFVYANVPYRIKAYADILRNPKDTIDFDHEADAAIRARREEVGADGALLLNQAGKIHRVGFLEKILASVLAKLSNYIPEGGIWMNTQRPEWNDANNALVGNGVSMVTLCYLRRYLVFFDGLLAGRENDNFLLSEELHDFFEELQAVFIGIQVQDFDEASRKEMVDALGKAATDYRESIYLRKFKGTKKSIALAELRRLIEACLVHIDYSIAANERADHLYQAYNLVEIQDDGMAVSHLTEMLEGQVAILSAGYLSGKQAVALLDGMKQSKLFRPDQYSYLLYPYKELPGFLERNLIPESLLNRSELLKKLLAAGNREIVNQDVFGEYHFNGNFKNAADLRMALRKLSVPSLMELAKKEEGLILNIFERVFNHREFTGRSGTFYGYEGLGSIYWHMVSKLLLAVQETILAAQNEGESDAVIGRLLDHYYEINAGIGVHKSPKLYGAFPTDPYSHTPAGKGAQQPGMTGQVKEDILSRFGELGVNVEAGRLHLEPSMLRATEFQSDPTSFHYRDLRGEAHELKLSTDSLAFTYCQVPIVYRKGDTNGLRVVFADGSDRSFPENVLNESTSEMLFGRSGQIMRIEVGIPTESLK